MTTPAPETLRAEGGAQGAPRAAGAMPGNHAVIRPCGMCGGTYPAGTYHAHKATHGPTTRPVRVRRQRWSAKATAIFMAWRSGSAAAEVAREFGVTREWVRQVVVRAGYTSTRHPRPAQLRPCRICGQDYEGAFRVHARAALHPLANSHARGRAAKTLDMAAAYAAGGDAHEVAAKYGVKTVTVYRAAAHIYGATRYSGKRAEIRIPKRRDAVAMLRNGDPNWLVAEATGLDMGTITGLRSRWVTAA